MDGVVVVEPAGQLADHGSGVTLFGDADVVSLHGPHERLSHSMVVGSMFTRPKRCSTVAVIRSRSSLSMAG